MIKKMVLFSVLLTLGAPLLIASDLEVIATDIGNGEVQVKKTYRDGDAVYMNQKNFNIEERLADLTSSLSQLTQSKSVIDQEIHDTQLEIQKIQNSQGQ